MKQLAKKAQRRVNRTRRFEDGCYTGKSQPRDTLVARAFVSKALKLGSVVLEIEGKYMRIKLNQRLRFTAEPSMFRKRRWDCAGKRYERYKAARSLREALEAGATQEDFVFHIRSGLVEWLPALKAVICRAPLPPSQWPPGIRVADRPRPWWLPDDWAQGIKTTCVTYLPVYIAPNGKTYYHQPVIDRLVLKQLGGLEGMRAHSKKVIDDKCDWAGNPVRFDRDAKLFACLSRRERSCLPSIDELHFCVVSARRAMERTGIRGITNVQCKLLVAGVTPRWYVDKESVGEYRALGLDAVVGGKLTPARNKALNDAERMGKVCVQLSDDIIRWTYYRGGLSPSAGGGNISKRLKAANAAAKSKDMLNVSPVAAARFLVAKMRASELRPRLGGVYPTGNAALGLLTGLQVSTDGFILGDFFVHDRSPCRFDESMTLKEDYDFTCTHLARHGSVLRVNRLIMQAAHESNPGGAVAERDRKGAKERANIRILQKKWPGVFRSHSTRGDTQVTMRWSRRSTDEE